MNHILSNIVDRVGPCEKRSICVLNKSCLSAMREIGEAFVRARAPVPPDELASVLSAKKLELTATRGGRLPPLSLASCEVLIVYGNDSCVLDELPAKTLKELRVHRMRLSAPWPPGLKVLSCGGLLHSPLPTNMEELDMDFAKGPWTVPRGLRRLRTNCTFESLALPTIPALVEVCISDRGDARANRLALSILRQLGATMVRPLDAISIDLSYCSMIPLFARIRFPDARSVCLRGITLTVDVEGYADAVRYADRLVDILAAFPAANKLKIREKLCCESLCANIAGRCVDVDWEPAT
jgi:hypothetical protein